MFLAVYIVTHPHKDANQRSGTTTTSFGFEEISLFNLHINIDFYLALPLGTADFCGSSADLAVSQAPLEGIVWY